jgi:SSS family solute:Na+ symporter
MGFIAFAFLAYAIRKIKYWTVPSILKARYGNGAMIVTAFLLIPGLIALTGIQIAALGTVFNATGVSWINFQTAAIIAGVVMIAYTIAGGMFAIAYTEIVQAVLILVIIGIAMPIFLFNGTQLSDVVAKLPPQMWNFWGGASPQTMVMWFLSIAPMCLIDVSLWQRASSAKSENVAFRSVLISGGIYLLYGVVVVSIGILGAYLYPNLVKDYGNADLIMPIMILNNLPTGMIGLAIAAIFAVLMSTAASTMMVAGMTVSSDIARLFKPTLSDKGSLIIARITIVIIGAIGILFSLQKMGIYDMLLLTFAIFISIALVPVMAALFWDKATKAGAIASMCSGAPAVVIFYAFNKYLNIEPIFAALVAMVVVSLVTYKKGVTPGKLYVK